MKELPEKEQQQRPKLQGSEQPKKQKDKYLRQKECSKYCSSQEEGQGYVKLCDSSKINHILDKSISINMQFSS